MLSTRFFQLGLVVFLFTSSASAHERKPKNPEKGLLFRIDLSAVGTLTHDTLSASVDTGGGNPEQVSFKSTGFAVGPKLLLNLGIAPTRLVRIGVYAAAEGAPQFKLDGDALSMDGQFRLSFGPTIGFRFGPKAPLELELGLGMVHMTPIGADSFATPGGNRTSLTPDQWGGETQAKLLFRPDGAGDSFALFAAGLGGFTQHNNGTSSTEAWLGGVELGVSIGY